MASLIQWTWVWANWVKHKEAWNASVHGVAKSQTWLWDWTTATEWFLKIILRPYLKSQPLDFSDGPEVKNLPFNAGIWRFNSIPGWGTKMPYAAEQLIPHAWTKQPACRTYWACKRQWRPNTAKKKKKRWRIGQSKPPTPPLLLWHSGSPLSLSPFVSSFRRTYHL